MSSRLRRGTLALAAAIGIALAAPVSAEESLAMEAGLGVGSALSTLVYGPLKLVYAASGAVISAFAYLWTWGDTQVAGPIFSVAIGGDYVVTPAHLAGEQDLAFAGPY